MFNDICEVVEAPEFEPEFESHDICEVFEAPEFEPEFETPKICEVFEALRLYVTKRKNTRVLAPRPRGIPQRGCVCMSKNATTRGFLHRDHAETRRGLSAARKKHKKDEGVSTATTPNPAEGCNPDRRPQPYPPP